MIVLLKFNFCFNILGIFENFKSFFYDLNWYSKHVKQIKMLKSLNKPVSTSLFSDLSIFICLTCLEY